ncbi:hypothetical protein Syun_013771 [Stephania yunnanensis]|uniref:CSN8/PSMD8/EIF3K domain-containing protein n=1 Tax=Stephania yunnanensis TaxID=152371 RepID=A0AAP0PB86_9MAGN
MGSARTRANKSHVGASLNNPPKPKPNLIIDVSEAPLRHGFLSSQRSPSFQIIPKNRRHPRRIDAPSSLGRRRIPRRLAYSIHLLGHIIADDINSARFLWKSMPGVVKESAAEVAAVWRIGQQLWLRDYAAVHEAVRGFDWSAEVRDLVLAFSGKLYTKRIFQLLLSAYSTISIGDTARFLGMTEEDAANYAQLQGWIMDPASGMLTVTKQPVVKEQKLDSSKLQRLTEYVFHLEH